MTSASAAKRAVAIESERSEGAGVEQHAAMTWVQRLKRIFNIDITIFEECDSKGGGKKINGRSGHKAEITQGFGNGNNRTIAVIWGIPGFDGIRTKADIQAGKL
jgi:hypothetical protein